MIELDVIKHELNPELIMDLYEMSNCRIAGFILYTNNHPNVIKLLRDNDYWTCFDELSGPNWPIFSVKPIEQNYNRRLMNSVPGTINMMISNHHNPNANREILKFFGMEEYCDLPCFVIFMWDDEQQLQQIDWKIDDYSVDTAYNSIKEVIELICKAEKEILPAYKRSTGVFRQVKSEIEARKWQKKVLRVVKGCESGLELMGSIASLLRS